MESWEGWQNGYCTSLENWRPQGLGGSNPSPSALHISKELHRWSGAQSSGLCFRLPRDSDARTMSGLTNVAARATLVLPLIPWSFMRTPMLAMLGLSAALLTGPSVSAQVGSPNTTPGPVTRVILIRITPGHADAFWQDVRQHLKPVYEEYKRRGIITDYTVATKSTTEKPDDWNVVLTLSYANWAAFDNLALSHRSGHPCALRLGGAAHGGDQRPRRQRHHGLELPRAWANDQRLEIVGRRRQSAKGRTPFADSTARILGSARRRPRRGWTYGLADAGPQSVWKVLGTSL